MRLRCVLCVLWLSAAAQVSPALSAAEVAQEVALPAAASTAASAAQAKADEALLLGRCLAIPVEGVWSADLRDTFRTGRPGHRHEAIDIAAPRGTKVFAVDDGKLVKLFTSVPGGLTIYQFDPQARFAYYYAHLDRYADGLREGMALHRCDLLGYVGTSGNAPADAPHLHFAAFRLGAVPQWWSGRALDPYPSLRSSTRTAAVAGACAPTTLAAPPMGPCH